MSIKLIFVGNLQVVKLAQVTGQHNYMSQQHSAYWVGYLGLGQTNVTRVVPHLWENVKIKENIS